MDDDNQQRYDDVHYPGFARRSTHPDRLATLATLFGLRPAELPNVRVLELGCGDGGNIIPIAMSLPGSQCVGIDLSPRAIFMEMQDFMLKPEAIETLNTIADGNLLVREQLLDFLKGRRFRQTLLCHTAQQIARVISPERLRPLLVSSQVTPLPGDGETVATTNTFKTSLGVTIEVTHPVASRVLHEVIQQAPVRVGFDDLLTMIDGIPEEDLPNEHQPNENRPNEHQPNEHQPEHDERRTQLLGEILLSLYAEDFIELHTFQPTMAHVAGDFPVASPLAQLQARTTTTVTNPLHQRIELEDTIGRRMVRLLDGSRDRKSIVGYLAREMADKSDISLEAIAADLEADLHQLTRRGLLLK